MNNYTTTFSEQKHRGVPTPIKRSRKPMPLEITTFRVAFVHTDYKLAYKLRDSINSLLIVYSLLRIFRLVCGFEKLPLLVTTLNPLSPKELNQTNNGKQIYIKAYYNCKDYFSCIICAYVPILTKTKES